MPSASGQHSIAPCYSPLLVNRPVQYIGRDGVIEHFIEGLKEPVGSLVQAYWRRYIFVYSGIGLIGLFSIKSVLSVNDKMGTMVRPIVPIFAPQG